MADSKLTALTELTTPDKADLLYIVDDPAGTPVSKKIAAWRTGLVTFVRKTADETVTSSTALQDDDHLLFAIGASETWIWDVYLGVNGATGGDILLTFSVPASATGMWHTHGMATTGASLTGSLTAIARVTFDDTDTGPYGASGTTTGLINFIRMSGIVVNSTNAGNVQLRWAQNASSGTATTVLTNSYLIARRVA